MESITTAAKKKPVEGRNALRPVVCCGAGFQLREAVESTASIMGLSRTRPDPHRVYSPDVPSARHHPPDTLVYRRIVEQDLHCTSIALTVDL